MGYKNYKPYTVIDGEEHEIEDEYGNIYAGEWQESKMFEDDDMICFGHHYDNIRGPRNPSKITKKSLHRHTLITGETGYGKSTVLNNINLQLIEQGEGITLVDPKGTESFNLLQRIPESRLDDVVYINPGSIENTNIGINLLQPDVSKEHENFVELVNQMSLNIHDLIRSRSNDWSPQISNITETVIKDIIRADENFNLIDFVKIMTDEEERNYFAENRENKLEQKFLKRIAEKDDESFDSILRIIRAWVEDRETRQMMAHEDNINLYKCLNNNKILILDLSNISSDESREVIIESFISKLWSNIEIGALDESESHFISLNSIQRDMELNIDNVVSKARSFNTGFIFETQKQRQLSDTNSYIRSQTCNKMAFNSGDDVSEASSVAQSYNIDANRILDLDKFELISHVMTKDGYESDIPVKVNTFCDLKPKREEIQPIIESCRDKFVSENGRSET